jgi:SAM-dependent methyltransferase
MTCGGHKVFVDFSVKTGMPNGEKFSVLRCADCGFGWTSPRLSDSDIQLWYPPTYYGQHNVRFTSAIEYLVRFLGHHRAKAVERHSTPGPALDVGCGRGCTLAALRTMGYQPFGVELNETAAWEAQHLFKIDVSTGDFLKTPYDADQFNVIIFWHSLEHFSQPSLAIRHAHKLLKPGGLLVVAVPNSESVQASWFRGHWFHLDIPRHYFHFGTRSLHALLNNNGFRIMKTSHLSLEQSPFGWLQSAYNAMGMEQNLLYSLLKNKTSRAMSMRTHPWQAMVIIFAAPILLPFAFLMTCIETALGRGGAIDVYAVKHLRTHCRTDRN